MSLPVGAADAGLLRCYSPQLGAADRCDAGSCSGQFCPADSPGPGPGEETKVNVRPNVMYY